MNRIKYFLLNCSIGNWYVLYQMSKNINPRLFCEFMTVLAETIEPDPTIENEEPEIFFSEEHLEKYKNGKCDIDSMQILHGQENSCDSLRNISGKQ